MGRRPKAQSGFAAHPVSRDLTKAPAAPESLRETGLAAWEYIWRQHWIDPDRHRLPVERYCRLRDLLEQAFAELERSGLMQLGSQKQLRCHPVLIEIRQLSDLARHLEVELALTPVSAAKARVPLERPAKSNADLLREAEEAVDGDEDPRSSLIELARRQRELDDDDPIAGLRVIEGGASS